MVLLLLTCAALIVGFFALVQTVHLGLFGPLPTREELASIQHEQATLVLAEDGTIIGKLFAQDRTNVRYEDLPQHLIDALVSTEDARFFRHGGVDGTSYLRVFFRTLLGRDRSGGGGSTISQQLVKNLYGRQRHGILTMPVNKVKEALVAQRLEEVHDKRSVLLLYLNSVPFGENVHGIESAARRYFGRPASRLAPQESAVLVGMLKANTTYNPRLHPEAARQRRNVVLSLMAEQGRLSQRACDSLRALPLTLRYQGVDAYDRYGYFVDRVAREASDLLAGLTKPGGGAWDLRKDGLRIHTTLDTRLQHLAMEAAREQLIAMQPKLDTELERTKAREAWERTMKRRRTGDRHSDVKARRLVYDVQGERVDSITRRDSLWHYHRMLHAAVLAMEPGTGRVRAWVGGNHHRHLPYDLVTAQRPIASAIKPILYAAALADGLEPGTLLDNSPRTYAEYEDWSPTNFGGDTTGGSVPMWRALARSLNLPTVDLYFRTDRDTLRRTFHALGLPTDRIDNPSLALGAVDLSLLRIVPAYAALAWQGRYCTPRTIEKVTDAQGRVLYQAPTPTTRPALDPAVAATTVAMLRRAVEQGTGAALAGRFGIRSEVAGKTGTSQDHADAWFVACTPGLAIGAWVGAMDPSIHFSSAAGTGSQLALPIVGRVLADVQRSPELRQRMLPPFSWLAAHDIDLDRPAAADGDGPRNVLQAVFGKRDGRSERDTRDKDKPREREGFFKRVFGKRDR